MKPLAQNTLIQNRYLIVHLIGKGGMGEVYLAVDQRLGSAVALKRTYFAGDEMLGNAFEREARTLARMRHPVLPKVSDHFGEGEEQYLVMEHISGDDLAKRLEAAQKPFPVSWVLFWADQLLDALSYLHTHEPPIIHRDIKPQNLKLTDENHVILLDFGLSKTSTGQTNISQSGSTGSVVGYTPHYAPMEQIRGIGTSPRSDLYSLSATLYQLMTNTIPVDSLSRADSMLNEMPDPIRPPHEVNPEIPKNVSDIILKAMEVSQDKRYADAREMQKVLRKAFNEMQQATTAKTIAFNVNDERVAAIDQPAGVLASGQPEKSVPPVQASRPPESSPAAVEAPKAEESDVDLEATMAYNSFPETPSKQADVRTEVFLSGGNSFPMPEKQAFEQPLQQGIPPGPSSENPFAHSDSALNNADAHVDAYSPDATVPFISVDETRDFPDRAGADTSAYRSGDPHGETFSTPATPYFEPPNAETKVETPVVAPAAVKPAKKSSKKALAVVGGLAALFLLAVVAAGGIWAYMNYSRGAAVVEPTPTPSPEETIAPTPTPEPTLETIVNSNSAGNTNSSGSDINANTQSDEPTGSPTPFSDSTPRPTPLQGLPKETPVRPAATPRDRPTPKPRKTPVTSPTVLQ